MREYFRNIRQNRIKLRMAQKRLRDMQENIAVISSPDLSGMPKGSRSPGDANIAHDVSEILEQEKYSQKQDGERKHKGREDNPKLKKSGRGSSIICKIY